VDDNPPRHRDDDHDDLAALDFSPPGQSDVSDLDALGYPDHDDETAQRGDEVPVPLFTVTNPPGTVTVTTYMDGRVHEVELSPTATTLTESMLAEEIVVIARLATQDARAAQYSFMLDGMNEQGQDSVATRDFLERDLELPSPAQATAARAAVFAQRYAGDHD